jgi:hypothetical protein
VAIWSHPVNRSLPQTEWLELRRLAICDESPRNTASWMLGVMARLIRRASPEITTLVSYQDKEVHAGTIYKAAGWTPTAVKKFASWTNAKRTRPADQAPSDKQRWELRLVPTVEPKE